MRAALALLAVVMAVTAWTASAAARGGDYRFDGGTQAQLTMDITFEDGSKSKLASTLVVHDVDPVAGARQKAA